MYRHRRRETFFSSSSMGAMYAMVIFVVVILMGILWASANLKLAEAQKELEKLRVELAFTQMDRDAVVDELYRLKTATVRATFLYDPAETIYRPADPNSSDTIQLIWFLGKVENLINENGEIVAPLHLTGYTCVYPDGSNVAGDYSVLLEAVQHQNGQMEELLAVVDANTGFIDR